VDGFLGDRSASAERHKRPLAARSITSSARPRSERGKERFALQAPIYSSNPDKVDRIDEHEPIEANARDARAWCG
jgi:hypothetical protein